MTIKELYNLLEKSIDCDGATLDSNVIFYDRNYSLDDRIYVDEDKDLIINA